MVPRPNKGWSSGRDDAGQDLPATPSDLRGEPFNVCIEDFLEFRPRGLGSRSAQISKQLDPSTAAVLVVPEIEVRSSPDLLRGHATTELHATGITLTLLKVDFPSNARKTADGPRHPHPIVSAGKAYAPTPAWTCAVDVLLVSLTSDVTEISALLASAGHRVAGTIVQRRDRPDPRTFVGRGKLDEVRDRLASHPVKVVVFNGELRPTMHHLLERDLHVECYDRIRVLLELFAQRASSREGKLQVELALLQYEVPLLREWIHEADIGERPGFMSGGEQRVEAYYETVKRRIRKIRDELESIRREREVRRTVRKDRGYHLVALAGYANAGKSSLLNALADEHLLVEDRMFSTLATTTRSLTRTRRRILLTDTIGFVDGVPFWMVEAFNATLEEILHADLILLLIDATDPEDEIRRKIRLAARTLFPKASGDSILPILTKTDRLPEERIAEKARILADSEFHRLPLPISAERGRGLPELRDMIHQAFAYPLELHLVLDADAEAAGKMNWLYEHTDVVSAVHGPDRTEVVVRCRTRDRDSIERLGRIVLSRSIEGLNP